MERDSTNGEVTFGSRAELVVDESSAERTRSSSIINTPYLKGRS